MSQVDPQAPDPPVDEERTARPFVRSLDGEVDALGADTLARLARARHRALASRRHPSFLAGARWPGLAVGGFATAMALVLSTTLSSSALQPHSSAASTGMILEDEVTPGDLPVLSADEDLEFYDSIDFLLWLERRRGA